MKLPKNLFLAGIAGLSSLAFSGCGNEKVKDKEDCCEKLKRYEEAEKEAEEKFKRENKVLYEQKVYYEKVLKDKKELIEYNSKNRLVYKDFIDFIKKHGEPYYEGSSDYAYTDKNGLEITVNYKDSLIHMFKENPDSVYFSEGGLDGMENFDGYKGKYIKNYPKEKQFSIADEYTETLKRVMHAAKYKKY